MFKKYVSDLKAEFKGYNGKKLTQDLMAGLTVAAVALPLALAFYFLSENRFVPAAALYGFALAIKPQALLAGPVLAAAFAAAFVRARAGQRLRTVLTTAACAALECGMTKLVILSSLLRVA